MYLKLTALNGHGYVSVFSSSNVSLSTKQVTSDEISNLAQQYCVDENYVVDMEGGEDGSMNWIVKEANKINPTGQCESAGQVQVASFDSRSAVEFARYKQDCRKRALDLAPSLCIGKGVEEVLPQAEKLYNWLISIPERDNEIRTS